MSTIRWAFLGAVFVFGPPICVAAQSAEVRTSDAADTPRMEADPSMAMLDAGFHDLYVLNFQGARAQFLAYQKMQPDDPLGKAAEAASYLYDEFNDKGVFTSAFFLNDSKLLGGVDGSPSQNRNEPFLGANHQAREMAKQVLKSNPREPHA